MRVTLTLFATLWWLAALTLSACVADRDASSGPAEDTQTQQDVIPQEDTPHDGLDPGEDGAAHPPDVDVHDAHEASDDPDPSLDTQDGHDDPRDADDEVNDDPRDPTDADADLTDGEAEDTDIAPPTPDPACGYIDLVIDIIQCRATYGYLHGWTPASPRDDCPAYYTIRGQRGHFGSAAEAAAAANCSLDCQWSPSMSVSWLRCGRRSGYIIFETPEPTCGALYEFPEGIFPSVEAYERAHPCPGPPARPPGQCASDADCPGMSTCTAAAPGGICIGCATLADCPQSTDECSGFGACRRACDQDEDCPRGQGCARTGFCRILACVEGRCPDELFGCNSSELCERRPCSDDLSCVSGSTCVRGLCIEGGGN